MHPNATAARQSSFSGLPGFGGGRGAVAKAASKGEWRDAFAAGCRVLKRTPGDTGVLAELAAACGELGHADCQLYYLRWALDLAPTDVELNRQAADRRGHRGEALLRVGAEPPLDRRTEPRGATADGQRGAGPRLTGQHPPQAGKERVLVGRDRMRGAVEQLGRHERGRADEAGIAVLTVPGLRRIRSASRCEARPQAGEAEVSDRNRPSGATKRFEGLISRWTSPRRGLR